MHFFYLFENEFTSFFLQMIGTTSSVQSVKRVKYPAISVCQIRNTSWQESKGLIFNGEDPVKFNATPDLSDFFLGMSKFHENSNIYRHYALQQVKAELSPSCAGQNCLYVRENSTMYFILKWLLVNIFVIDYTMFHF